MEFTDIDKYGFPFDWFLEIFDSTNNIRAYNLNCVMKTKINNLYVKNYLNYKKFVDEISCLLNISLEDKNKYLEKEEYCRMCNNHYPHSYELFTEFIDYHTLKIINVCFDCGYSKYNCSNCESNFFGYEPYEKIYVYSNAEFKNKKLLFCNKCFLNKDNIPIIGLFFKNVDINIEFKDLNKNS